MNSDLDNSGRINYDKTQEESDTSGQFQSSGFHLNANMYFIQHGIFIPEDKFLDEEYFKQNSTDSIVQCLEEFVQEAFSDSDKSFFVLCAKYLKKDGNYRKAIHNFIDENHPELVSKSVGLKNYILICKRNEVFDKIKTLGPDDIQGILDVIYLKFFNTDGILDQEEKSELGIIEEGIDSLNIDSTGKKKNQTMFLPIVQKFEFYNIKATSVQIKLPELTKEAIVRKNRNYIRGFGKLYEKTKINYVTFLYEADKDKFVEKIESDSSIFILDKLAPGKGHLVKFSIKFDRYYSPLSKVFMFYTSTVNTEFSNSYYAWGNNKLGCLLVGKDNCDTQKLEDASKNEIFKDDEYLPQRIRLNNSKVLDFSSYYDVTYLLLSSGEVVSSGKIYSIGDGEMEFDQTKIENVKINYSSPYIIAFPWGVSVRKVACGLDFCVALSLEGHCYSWGSNDLGQLGLNLPNETFVGSPKKVNFQYENLPDREIVVTDIQTGAKHCLAKVFVNEKIRLFSWGYGQGYEPLINPNNVLMQKLVDERLTKVTNAYSPLLLKFHINSKILKIIAKYNQSAIICEEYENLNTVYTFGVTSNFQLGYQNSFVDELHYWAVPTHVCFFSENNISVLDVSYSEAHTLFLVKNLTTGKHDVFTCGVNNPEYCPNGIDSKSNSDFIITPVKVPLPSDCEPVMISAGKNQSFILSENDKLFMLGKSNVDLRSVSSTGGLVKQIEFPLRENEKLKKICCTENNIQILTTLIK